MNEGLSSRECTGASGSLSRLTAPPPPDVIELARVEDRISFAYFEHCMVSQEDNAITVANAEGVVRLPSASLAVLMLGPGSTVTHKAMATIAESGATVVWVGENGVRMYASARPLTHSSALLQKQAKLVSNVRTRLAVARQMYQMRFPGEDVSRLTMQQLRGREGARIRSVYRKLSAETGVAWDKRTYDHDDYEASSEINKALSAAHTCLYGLVHAVIVAIGCSPGLGFVHTGHERSFVYDIADLYKAEISIPVAFEITSLDPEDIGSAVRHEMRDRFYDLSLLSRIAKDIKLLLQMEPDEISDTESLSLWDDRVGRVAYGKAYGLDEENEDA